MQSTIRLCAITLASALLAIAAPAQAQSPPIPDSKLDAAATAAKNAADIKDAFDQKLAAAPVEDKRRIAIEADKAMVKAVTDQGLTLDEFKAIMRLAQHDPDVRSRFVQRLQ